MAFTSASGLKLLSQNRQANKSVLPPEFNQQANMQQATDNSQGQVRKWFTMVMRYGQHETILLCH